MEQFNSPLEAFLYWEKHQPDQVFLNQKINGRSIKYTFGTAGKEIRKIANALKSYGLAPLSHVALLSKNCAHWFMSDLAIMMAGYVSIPIYPTLTASAINQILVHSDSKLIIVGKLDNYKSQKDGIPNIPIISIKLYDGKDGTIWEDLISSTAPLEKPYQQDPDDLISIIYTSGTTGLPKGVMHTVGNFICSANTFIDYLQLPKNPKFFSYLPLAHIAERVGIGVQGIVLGANITFPESLDTFAADLEETQPHLFFAVPRIWTKFQEKILEKLSQKKLNLLLTLPVINKMIKKKLKLKLGLNEAVVNASGAAPLSSNTNRWFKSIGIDILEGYGMTEDCIISHANKPRANKIGTVGQALPGVKIKFSQEGEICIKNNCLMKGYYKADELTKENFTSDGYFKTGDLGAYDHDGYLSITGRAKDQFKTDKGKYIAPTPIELKLGQNPDIEQICIVGTGIPQPIALITLSQLGQNKKEELLKKSLENTLDKINPQLEKHEKIEKFVIMKEDWTVDNGLITPTLKVKRNNVEKLHQEYYQSWFTNKDLVIFE